MMKQSFIKAVSRYLNTIFIRLSLYFFILIDIALDVWVYLVVQFIVIHFYSNKL